MKNYFTVKVFALLLILSSVSGPSAGAFGTVMAIAGETDVKKRIIPNWVCLLVALLGMSEILSGPGEQVKWRALNVLLAIVIFSVMKLVLKNSVGMGDIKLLMACSFCLDISSVLIAMAIACLGAGLTGIIVTRTVRGEMPLAPFLAVSMSIVKIAETL